MSEPKRMRTLLITCDTDGGFSAVRDGREIVGQLGPDEALYVASLFVVAPETRTPFQPATPESYWEMKRKVMEEVSAALRPVDRLLITERRSA